MPNPYYNVTGAPATDSFGRSDAVRAEFAAVAAGLDAVSVVLAATLRAPSGETMTLMPAAASRAGKAVIFDGTGLGWNLQVVASEAQMLAAVAAAQTAITESAKVSYPNAMATLLYLGY